MSTVLDPPTEVSRIAQRAIELIEEQGWRQGSTSLAGRICMGEALYLAKIDLDIPDCEGLWKAFQPGPMGIVMWNDSKGRTEEEVIDFLRSKCQGTQ